MATAGPLYDDDALNHDVVTALYTALIDWPEFWAQDHSAEEWIAWPLIPAHRQVALFAEAKSGKSWITLAVCAAVATGRDILGQRNHAGPRHVLYLDYEMTEADLHERLESLDYGPDDDLTHLHYALLPTLPPLNTPKGSNALCGLAAAVDAEVVVIDTMGRAVAGEENSADAYREFAQTTGLALKQAGRAVLRTDHAGKEKLRGQRGSSAKNDDVDVVLRIDRVEDGVTITRTHSRVSWVPETVFVRRTITGDVVHHQIDGSARPFAAGTNELVATLRSLGATASTSRSEAISLLKAADIQARTKRIGDALRWMREETARFGVETVGTAVGTNGNRGNRSGTAPGTELSTAPGNRSGNRSEPTPSTSGNHDGNRAEPDPRAGGNQRAPLKGAQVPSPTPDDGWDSFLADLDSGFYDTTEEEDA